MTYDPLTAARPPIPEEMRSQLRTSKEACAQLRIALATLNSWKQQGIGPESIKLGGRRFYPQDGIDAFIAKHRSA